MGENPIHRKTKVSRGRLVRPGLVGPKERPKGVSDGQQVDIPVLEYIVIEGRSRLTKPDEWKSLAKQ